MAKSIVVCLDGTGNKYGEHNTNVVNLYQAIRQDPQQVAYYDTGVGTFSPKMLSQLSKGIGKLFGKAFGYGVLETIGDAYRWLMSVYEPGDKIYLFGFSRGAYTARALGGVLYRGGLLQKGLDNLVPYAMEMYTNTKIDKTVVKGFKATYARPCPVHFIGVWDTVDSMGYLWSKRYFVDATLNPEITFGCHALAIDERRRKFPPNVWQKEPEPGQAIEQVWFAGVHSDVGGWYDEHGLSDIALEWMLARATSQGLMLKSDYASHITPKPEPDPEDQQHESFSGAWRLLGSRRRSIPEGCSIHDSVLKRLKSTQVNYRPKNLPHDETTLRERFQIVST